MFVKHSAPKCSATELTAKAVTRVGVKKVFFKISQNSQEKTCVRVSFLIKLQLQLQLQITYLSDLEFGKSFFHLHA